MNGVRVFCETCQKFCLVGTWTDAHLMLMDSERVWGDRGGGFCGRSLIGFPLLWFGVNGEEFRLGELESSWRCLRGGGGGPRLGQHVERSGGGVSEVGEESTSWGAGLEAALGSSLFREGAKGWGQGPPDSLGQKHEEGPVKEEERK